jgi:hypothetical protein
MAISERIRTSGIVTPLQHNFLIQRELRPGPVTEVEQTASGCP